MFDAVLKAEVARQAVPVDEVQFWQRERELFGGMVGQGATTGGRGSSREEVPLVVPVRQTDRRLFGRIVDGRAEPPAEAPVEATAGALALVVPFGPSDHVFFQTVVRRDLGRRAARRGAWALAATVVQTVMVTATAFITAHLAAFAAEEDEPVPVEIVAPRVARAAPRGPPPPPPAAPMGARRAGPLEPRPAGYKPPAPAALLQPREIQPEMKTPAPGDPGEDLEYGFVGEEEGGVVGGVVGGVPGGVIGGVIGGTLGRGGGGGEFDEAPQYALAGFRRPAEAEPGCVRRTIRIPAELAGYVSGPVTVKFGVGREGRVGLIQIMGEPIDPRIGEAIRRAVAACRWVAGADPRGEPIALWVILPVRFQND
jgi:protein TonB